MTDEVGEKVESGEVITFYSYKGGTGRTMALANTACLLAQSADGPVLMIDWDLEAPGLHAFFRAYLGDRQNGVSPGDPAHQSRPGLIELFWSMQEARQAAGHTRMSDVDAADLVRSVRWDDYIFPLELPNLYLLSAGRLDEGYSDRINSFDWHQFYDGAPGVLPALAATLADRFRYVLVDSRTGVTDTSGICTALLPSKLVIVFTPNRQSLLGGIEIARGAAEYRRKSEDLRPLVLFPLASRVELSEDELRRSWRHGDPSSDQPGYQPMFEATLAESYALDTCDLTTYFDEVQVQYFPTYAYGESIAVLDDVGDRLSLSRSYQGFTEWLTSARPPWVPASTDGAQPRPDRTRTDFYITFAPADRDWASWIAGELRAAGYSVELQDDVRPGQDWALESVRAIRRSDRVVVVLSPAYLSASANAGQLSPAFFWGEKGTGGALLPVRVEECRPTGLLGQMAYVDLVGLDEYSARGALLSEVRHSPTLAPAAALAGKPAFPSAPRRPTRFTQPPWGAYFEGRETLLAELQAGRVRRAFQVVCGMGGIGKTRLVSEYAYRSRAAYQRICWVNAGGRGPLVSEYAALAVTLDVRDSGSLDQTFILAAVRRRLSELVGVLLVLDGAPGPDELVGDGRAFQTVLDFLPDPGTTHVVVTTRDAGWMAVSPNVLYVPPLASDEAVAFLLKRTGSGDETGAQELAEVVGCLPLALEQAGAYISQTHVSFVDYLSRLETYPELYAKAEPLDYGETVATTWRVSMDEVRAGLPGAADMLEVCAFLGPDDIPRSLFSQRVPELSPALQEIAGSLLLLDEAVGRLARHSLVLHVDQQSIQVHRLVQHVVRNSLPPAARMNRAATAIALVDALLPPDMDDPQTWVLCDRLAPHAEAAASWGTEIGLAGQAAARLLDRLARYRQARDSVARAGEPRPEVAIGGQETAES